MDKLFTILKKKALKRKSFQKSDEYHFFLENRNYLEKLNNYRFLYNSEEHPFDVMRANIILHGFVNKKNIEAEILSLNEYKKSGAKIDRVRFLKTIREKIVELPYFLEGVNKIYIPFFTRSLNEIYIRDPEKILTFPYNKLAKDFLESFIDPFDSYGFHIFNSSFSRLILIGINQNNKEAAFFHYDTNTIYMINDQGRLDAEIVLFDKYLKHPSYSHMLERIKPVVDAYFNCSRSDFIEALYKNDLISSKLIAILRKGSIK